MKKDVVNKIYDKLQSDLPGLFFSPQDNYWYSLKDNRWIPVDIEVGEKVAAFLSSLAEARVGYSPLMERIKLMASQSVPLNHEAKYILNTRSGVLNLSISKAENPVATDGLAMYKDHPESIVKEKRITEITSAAYLKKNKTKPEKFIAFINDIFRSDKELVRFFWLYLASILTGDTSDHRFFVCFGTGANGKSTLLRVLEGVFGSYISKLDPSVLHARTDTNQQGLKALYRLRYKRLIVMDEPPAKLKLDVPFLKRITGEDSLPVPVMGRRGSHLGNTFQLEAKVIMDTNHLPHVPDVEDEGLWRRMTIIPFRPTVPLAERKEDLLLQLLEERDQILTHIVDEWYPLWVQEKLKKIPERVNAASELYVFSMNPVRYFLSNRVHVRSIVLVGHEKIQSQEIWKAYIESTQNLTRKMEDVFGLPAGKGLSFIASGSNKMLFTLLEQQLGGVKKVVNGRHFWTNVTLIPIGVDSNAKDPFLKKTFHEMEKSQTLQNKALKALYELRAGNEGEQAKFMHYVSTFKTKNPTENTDENCLAFFDIWTKYLISSEEYHRGKKQSLFVSELQSFSQPLLCKMFINLNAAIFLLEKKDVFDSEALLEYLVEHFYLGLGMANVPNYFRIRTEVFSNESKGVKLEPCHYLGYPDYFGWANSIPLKKDTPKNFRGTNL